MLAKVFRSAFVLIVYASTAHTVSAQIDSVSGPIPTADNNPLYGAADVPGAKLGISLKPFGYIEQEFFIQGKAAAYEHTPTGLKARTDKLPYTTRIIVRRPENNARFSGVVHFEPIHPTHGYNGHWLALNRYLMSRGDIYVFVGLGDANQGWSGSPSAPDPDSPIGHNAIARWFNPARYSALDWPEEEGIRFEVMADIGQKLRSTDPDNPLRDVAVKAILVGGWSYTGGIQQTFINEGFHDRARLPDGKPVFDGYFMGVASHRNRQGYLPLYNDEPFVSVDNPRRQLPATDARVMRFLTESEVELAVGQEIPDSDETLGGYRTYEFAGVVHYDSLHDATLPVEEQPHVVQLLEKGYRFNTFSNVSVADCDLPQSDLPQGAFVRAALDNLRRWVLDGTPPPRAEPLRKEGDILARDEVGNVLGGIRPAELELPLARYGRYQGQDKPTCRADETYPNVFFVRDPLSREELVRRYQSVERYVQRYDREIDQLVAERWLLPEDALRLKAKAREDARMAF